MLSFVATPIGNLRDITLRALDTLKEADLIVCEDTRRTKILLDHYGITGTSSPQSGGTKPSISSPPVGEVRWGGSAVPLQSFHEHSGSGKVDRIIALAKEGKKIALVSDGGMPLISDPGFELLREAIKNQIPIEVIPGPSACVTALAASGLATDSFTFYGFLAQKSAARKKELAKLTDREETLIFYESPYRLLKTLEDMKEILGDREAVVARELTKKFEEISRGHLSTLIGKFSPRKILGEIVVLVSGKNRKEMFEDFFLPPRGEG